MLWELDTFLAALTEPSSEARRSSRSASSLARERVRRTGHAAAPINTTTANVAMAKRREALDRSFMQHSFPETEFDIWARKGSVWKGAFAGPHVKNERKITSMNHVDEREA
jgi:hypothetical protein